MQRFYCRMSDGPAGPYRCKLVNELMGDVGSPQHSQGPALLPSLQEVLQQRLIVLRRATEQASNLPLLAKHTSKSCTLQLPFQYVKVSMSASLELLSEARPMLPA